MRPPVDVRGILDAFAHATPSSSGTAGTVDVGGGPFVWVGTERSQISTRLRPREVDNTLRRRDELRRLASLDAVHRHERILREGWVFLCGPVTIDGKQERLCAPILTQPVRLKQQIHGYTIVGAGDVQVTPLVIEPNVAAMIESSAQFGGGALDDSATTALVQRLPALGEWIRSAAIGAGLPSPRIVGPHHHPLEARDGDAFVAVVGTGLFVSRDVNATNLLSTLRNWSSVARTHQSAFAALYADAEPAKDELAWPEEPVVSPLELTERQKDVVRRSRRERLTVVSGAPGCGKSHVLVAAALDAVSRGESVLVATQSSHAADALAELFERYPGPEPVLFGDSEHRERISGRIADVAVASELFRKRRDEPGDVLAARVANVARIDAHLEQLLEVEADAAMAESEHALLVMHRGVAPRAFDVNDPAEHATIEARLGAAARKRRGWIGRLRARRALARLRDATGSAESSTLSDIEAAIAVARRWRRAAALATSAGTELSAAIDELIAARESVAAAAAAMFGAVVVERSASPEARRAASSLGAALRMGRARRREALRRLDAAAIGRALPLWLGTLTDVDDLLPETAAGLDLVILDEASQVDQRYGALALLRGKRAIVAGDPRQLRHVSFVSDASISAAVAEHHVTDLADRLDLRRLSTYDVASGAARVTELDEHFRSVPHLIGFSLARFYESRTKVATMHPATDTVDAIDVVAVADGARNSVGANDAEVAAVAEVLREVLAQERGTIGLLSPIRAQADALEQLALELPLEVVEERGIEVGTVHSFQGHERDVVIVSTAVASDDAAAARRFVEDPNLFNVMVTRARRRLIVVTSLGQLPRSTLLGSFLEYASHGPRRPTSRRPVDEWTSSLASELSAAGLSVRSGYPVGCWTLDLVVGDGHTARSLETRVHPDGPRAHIDRRLQLLRGGWHVVDAFPSRFDRDPVRAAVALTAGVDD